MTNSKIVMTIIKKDGSEKVNQYWSCHSVTLIDNYIDSKVSKGYNTRLYIF